ncbi:MULTISPECIES: MmcQ/YjbR family DNA-binding protein [unclassified Streptomyces]|uniref:MmcQ/YjbR family DNA-binding protein n=1 Tax=unclassified Streptomyces TaxID=2593676 RepID=UPI002E1366A4|nr:MmcQ/YjbR family DNA-binding protein [Streptomyces sp. NBC_01207]WTA19747.1 MmcQ/YjbR family DNA-binding protein [Streptomyces sp. NBC_00853]
MATVDDVRRLAMGLPRTEEHLIRDRVKFRIGKIVYLALSRDESELGFAFPKEERAALVAAEPQKFFLPRASDLRFHWVEARLAALEEDELTELVTEAWRMVVPAKVARAHLDPPAAPPLPPAPSLAELRSSAEVFNGFAGVDRSWQALRDETGGALDLSLAAHRSALHRWLNSWGCRIRYPREGEPDAFGAGLAAWWGRHALAHAPLARLTPREISRFAAAYEELAALPIGRRSLGPTAAAKALYALRPDSVMPWDAAIAVRLHGVRDGAAFARHLELGRSWARTALEEGGGLDEAALCAEIGRPGVSLAKILDEHLYVTITHAA